MEEPQEFMVFKLGLCEDVDDDIPATEKTELGIILQKHDGGSKREREIQNIVACDLLT